MTVKVFYQTDTKKSKKDLWLPNAVDEVFCFLNSTPKGEDVDRVEEEMGVYKETRFFDSFADAKAFLDDKYENDFYAPKLLISNELNRTARNILREYILDDTHRMENYADYEMCTSSDAEVVREIISRGLECTDSKTLANAVMSIEDAEFIPDDYKGYRGDYDVISYLRNDKTVEAIKDEILEEEREL